MMEYESPIKINKIAEAIIESHDAKLMEHTMKVLYKYGIEVDEQRLLNALAFDRAQYYEGYQNGYAQAKDDMIELIQGMQKEEKNEDQSGRA